MSESLTLKEQDTYQCVLELRAVLTSICKRYPLPFHIGQLESFWLPAQITFETGLTNIEQSHKILLMKSKKKIQRSAKTSPKAPAQMSPSTEQAPEICSECGEFIGRSYPHCSTCRDVAEAPIRIAWQELLQARDIAPGTPAERELAATILEQPAEYWWSEVEAAMRLTACSTCGGPLGYGSPECAHCWSSSDMFWGKDGELAADGTLVRNEHALRVVLRGLAQEKRHSQASLEGWRLYIPFLLRNIAQGPGRERHDVSYAQAISAWIKAGRGHELFHCQSVEEMYAITRSGRSTNV